MLKKKKTWRQFQTQNLCVLGGGATSAPFGSTKLLMELVDPFLDLFGVFFLGGGVSKDPSARMMLFKEEVELLSLLS